MIPWEQLAVAHTPDGDDLRLMRRGAEFSIMAGAYELMNSRVVGSEVELARLACDAIAGRPRPRLLIGGLGMGFTLRSALAEASADASIEVAEIVPEVIAWARGPLADIHGEALADQRVAVRHADVARLIDDATAVYDAILLDVDNGPKGLSREANSALYRSRGLSSISQALRPGGVLAVWSAHQDDIFARRLRSTGFQVREVHTRARGTKGPRQVIWLAIRP